MQKFKTYISILFLALLLLPVAEKVMHELGHLEEDQCRVSETHFCKAEHHCSICAYVFASSSTPPHNSEQLSIVPSPAKEKSFPVYQCEKFSRATLKLLLRGPPAA
ncbi:hypothetical protein CNR22_22205 [Sphingobacteriaceae bacterium]|nr:hypothetical protein CNR22_22205 [Sphingobacteriaceae bacterium]